MRIHIVTDRIDSDRIISRLAQTLADYTHFSISETPDDTADLNYFVLYLLYPKEGYNKTLTAALFSHKEVNVPSKLKEWERVAKVVDLRLYWSNIYKNDLEQYGKTAKIIPYLDRNKFNVK